MISSPLLCASPFNVVFELRAMVPPTPAAAAPVPLLGPGAEPALALAAHASRTRKRKVRLMSLRSRPFRSHCIRASHHNASNTSEDEDVDECRHEPQA